MGEMRIITTMDMKELKGIPPNMRRSGDTKIMWNPNNPVEVENARRSFEYIVKEEKYLAYLTDKEGQKTGKPITEFDPTAGKILIFPPIVGG